MTKNGKQLVRASVLLMAALCVGLIGRRLLVPSFAICSYTGESQALADLELLALQFQSVYSLQSNRTSEVTFPREVIEKTISEYSGEHMATRVLDPWDRPYCFSFRGFVYPEIEGATAMPDGEDVFRIWSSGRNGVNEFCEGDDLFVTGRVSTASSPSR